MVGSWHQAMVYGAGLADIGHRVRGVCETRQIADQLNRAEPTVYEPGLAALMRRNIRRGRLRYTDDYADALDGAAFVFISIDTPVASDDRTDLTPVVAAARAIALARDAEIVLCVSAQVPVGTSQQLLEIVRGGRPHLKADVAYVPEFLRLGTAIHTFRKADRVVIGADDPRIAAKVAGLYRRLGRPITITDVRTAEMAKHASNTFLATSISFVNEIANLCEETGADAQAVAAILKQDKRIGPHAFLSPGLGYAGGTLGRDVRALQDIGKKTELGTPLLDAVWTVNAGRADRVVRRIAAALGGLAGRRVAVFGLTYKPGTSTLRRAISLDIIRHMTAEGAQVRAFDPLADLEGLTDLPPFERCDTPYRAAEGADVAVLLTEWEGIGTLSFGRLAQRMRGRMLVDTRNLFDRGKMARAGFTCLSIGRSDMKART